MYSTAPASTFSSLLKTPATIVWFVLIAATLLSWMLGTNHGFSTSHSLASVLILLVAFIKVRFIGLWFMELREAPIVLRGIFEAYCLVVCVLVTSLFLLV